MYHYNFISKLVARPDKHVINKKLFTFYKEFNGQKAIEFCTKCSPELLDKISELCENHFTENDKVELFFGEKMASGEIIYSQVPKGINFAEDKPVDISIPTPLLDSALDVERKYILLVYQKK